MDTKSEPITLNSSMWKFDMHTKLQQIMSAHGLHKHISQDCQHRMEFLYDLIVRECCQKLEADGMVEVAMEMKEHFGVEP